MRRRPFIFVLQPEQLESRMALCASIPLEYGQEIMAPVEQTDSENVLVSSSLLQHTSGTFASSSNHPSVQFFNINTTGAKGSSTDSEIDAVVSGYEADVQSVWYTDQSTFVYASGVPSYDVGPWPDGNPAIATDRNWLFTIPHHPQVNTGTKTTVLKRSSNTRTLHQINLKFMRSTQAMQSSTRKHFGIV